MTAACIVVAGGAARRMGGLDKAALRVGGATLLDIVLAAAQPLCSRLVVVGPTRPTELAGVVFTTEAKSGGGPVPAVVAGLAAAGEAEEIFVLAADLALLSTRGLELLLGTLRQHDAAAAAAADDKGDPNPLLAVYRSDALRDAVQRLGNDHEGVAAARLLPQGTVTARIGLRETLNVNTPADLATAQAEAATGPRIVRSALGSPPLL